MLTLGLKGQVGLGASQDVGRCSRWRDHPEQSQGGRQIQFVSSPDWLEREGKVLWEPIGQVFERQSREFARKSFTHGEPAKVLGKSAD